VLGLDIINVFMYEYVSTGSNCTVVLLTVLSAAVRSSSSSSSSKYDVRLYDGKSKRFKR